MKKSFFLQILITSILVPLDQITKYSIKERAIPYHINTTTFIFPLPNSIIILLSFLLLLILFAWFIKVTKESHHYLSLSLNLILAGGLSNFIDRLTLGYVLDWIYLPFFPFSVFNLADTYILIGTVLAIFAPKLKKHQSN
jgi:lipoprotein signal peptidase